MPLTFDLSGAETCSLGVQACRNAVQQDDDCTRAIHVKHDVPQHSLGQGANPEKCGGIYEGRVGRRTTGTHRGSQRRQKVSRIGILPLHPISADRNHVPVPGSGNRTLGGRGAFIDVVQVKMKAPNALLRVQKSGADQVAQNSHSRWVQLSGATSGRITCRVKKWAPEKLLSLV
jgi:hypothetical protein